MARLVFHVSQRRILAVHAFGLVGVIDNAFVEHGQAVFQVIAQERQIEQILRGAS